MIRFSTVYLAAEDRLGAACGRRLIGATQSLSVCREYIGHGKTRLRIKAPHCLEMARRGLPVLLLTDLDREACVPNLLHSWLGSATHPNFLLRVAVRETEAWLLADPAGLAALIRVSPAVFPPAPEELEDPKAELLRIVRRAPGKVQKALLPASGSTAKVGPEYNEWLEGFVSEAWDWQLAMSRAPSLQRASRAIQILAERATKEA